MEFYKNCPSNAAFKSVASYSDSISQEPSINSAPVQARGSTPYQTPVVEFGLSHFSLISDNSEGESIVLPDGVISNCIPSTQDKRTLEAGECYENAKPATYYCSESNKLISEVYPTGKLEQEMETNTIRKDHSILSPKQQLSKACYNSNSSSNDLLKNRNDYMPECVGQASKMNSPSCSKDCCASNCVQNFKRPYKIQENYTSSHPGLITSKINLPPSDENITIENPDKPYCAAVPDHASVKYLDFSRPMSSSFHFNEPQLSRKHNFEGAAHSKCCNFELQALYSEKTKPYIPLTNHLTHTHKSLSTCVPDDIVSVLHQKVVELQNQLSNLQHQKDQEIKELQNQLTVSQQQKFMSEHRLYESIDRLQHQFSVLMKRTDEFESLILSKNSDNFMPEPNSLPYVENKADSENNIACHENTQVKKTSSSTMTSFTLEGNNKFVFCKKTTVAEDFSYSKKGMQAQCPQQKNSDPSKGSPNKALSPLNEANSKECASSKPVKLKKHLKKIKDSEKNEVEDIENNHPADCDLCSPSQYGHKGRKSSSPLTNSDKINRNSKKPQFVEERTPNAKSIDRNIARLLTKENNGIDEDPHSKRDSSHSPKYPRSRRKEDTPVLVCSPEKRNKLHKRSERSSSASSSTSCDSISSPREVEAAPNYFQSPKTKELYGLKSIEVSYDTQEYLQRHKLFGRKSASPFEYRR